MFDSLGRQIGRIPWVFLLTAMSLVLLAAFYGRDVHQHLTLSPGWDVPGSRSMVASQGIIRITGRDDVPVVLLFSARPGQNLGEVDSPAFRNAVEASLAEVRQLPEVSSVRCYYGTADTRMRSEQGDMVYATLMLARGDDDGMAAYQNLRKQMHSASLQVRLGGQLAADFDARERLMADVQYAEMISFVALAVLLLWVFGSAVAAMLPLLTGAITIAISAALLKICAQLFDVNVYAANVVSMLGLGLSIDYALFMVSRYREELHAGRDEAQALQITLATAGRTVAFSGLTVAVSLFCLVILPQRFFQNMGLAGGISVASGMLASILILPAMLRLLGRRVDWLALPVLARRVARREHGGRWLGFSLFVLKHPWKMLLASLLVLGFIGLPITHMQISASDSRALPEGTESRVVQEILESQFPEAELSPIILVVRTQGNAHEGAGLIGVHDFTRSLEALPNVARVQSLTTLIPDMQVQEYAQLYRYPDSFPGARAALDSLSRDDQTLVLAWYRAGMTTLEARELVREIRALPLPEGVASVAAGGFAAAQQDYVDALFAGIPWVILAIVCVVFVLLFVMLGSVLVPFKAVLTNLVSLSATFGGLVWLFQDGNLSGLLGFTPQAGLEGTVLMLVFASAFGLSIDYELFLISRVKEACAATGDSISAIATGLTQSGPIITSAALLIGIVLGTFAMGELVFMKAMGLGLLISVIIDATLVRMLLVPATLRLLGRGNWWAPPALQRLHQRIGIHH